MYITCIIGMKQNCEFNIEIANNLTNKSFCIITDMKHTHILHLLYDSVSVEKERDFRLPKPYNTRNRNNK